MKKLRRILLFILISMVYFIPIKALADDAAQIIILIDPGHGGIDGGAKSKSGVIEKDINLQISLKLKDILEKKGYKVYLTRESDQGLEQKGSTIREKKRDDLKRRRDLKIETKCDVF